MIKLKQILIASTLFVSVTTFAQKEELKGLKKLYAKEVPTPADMVEYKANLSKLETLAVEESDKVYTNFYKGMLPIMEITALGPNISQAKLMSYITVPNIVNLEPALNATLDFEKKSGKKVYTDDIIETIQSFGPQFLGYADLLGKDNKYKESSQVLYSLYKLDKKNADNLYFAANYAYNAKEYDASLNYFNELKALNYSGESTLFFAKNNASNKEEQFATKEERDNFVKLKTHSASRDEKIPSKKGEIAKTIAALYVETGKNDEAKLALSEARKSNPDDVDLILSEADLYYKLKDMDAYKRLVGEALQKKPNDANLIFNLGVTSSNSNQLEEAEKYYKKVIEIDPTYFNAYLNLSELSLRGDQKYITEMNKLGTSEKDTKRYDAIKIERDTNLKKIIPLLEKAIELKPDNEDAKQSLLSVYNALDMTEKYKALKAKN